ncbi:MAG TPA: dihydropteroate synthase [Geobacteraceae bacterium]
MTCSLRVLSVKSPLDAERELAEIGLDPFSIRNLGPQMLHRLLLLDRIGSREGDILKKELRSLGGDVAMPSGTGHGEASIILMGTDKQLRRLCANLSQQSFGLPSLSADILRLLDTEADPPRIWKIGKRTLDLSRRPCIMGVLNVTPDSFSDGNRFSAADEAVERALAMQEEGADIIDIGGESTRPGACPVDQDEELRRIMPVLERLAGELAVPVSVDTFKSAVAKEALAAGAEIVNDISGLTFDERMAMVVASADAGLVLMHTRGKPDDMQKDTAYSSLISEVTASLKWSLSLAEAAGIAPERIVVDPGIGFGKSVRGNLEILRKLSEFSVLGRPILVGTSRKSFIGAVLDRPVADRVFGTAATVALALGNGASILRVHDVREMRDVADMAMALIGPAKGPL